MIPGKVLITGATGFIGTRLCERFKLYYGVPYRALVRSYTHAARIARMDAEMVSGDLMQPESLAKALVGCDTVVHLAHSDDALAAKETGNIVTASLQAGVKRFVHISSMSVHGPNPGPECAREETAVIGRYGSSYSDAKAAAEELVQRHIRKSGLPAIILRPTIVYGPYSGFVTEVVKNARSGEITLIDEGRWCCNAVYVDDVCDAIYAALRSDEGVGKAMFVTADSAITWREFNLTFARMVCADCKSTTLNSDDIRAHWQALRPTLRSNVGALVSLAASPQFHRQLTSVPALGWAIRKSKETLKRNLVPEKVVALKRLAKTSSESCSPIVWPTESRLRREAFPIQFSNELARKTLNWKPVYNFQQGAEVAKMWLDFARMLPLQCQ